MNTGYALGTEVNNNASGVIAAAYYQCIYAEFFESLFNPFIFIWVCNFTDLYPGMACLTPCQRGLDTADPLCIKQNHGFESYKVVETGVAVGNYHRFDTQIISLPSHP